MIRLIRDWWRRRTQQRRRLLLTYWDGARTRRADPWFLYRALLSQQEVDIVAVAPLVDQMKEPETSLVVNAIAKAFQVTRWDPDTGTGLTDCEILNLMGDLDEYLLAVKKKVQPWADAAGTYGLAVLSLSGGPPCDYETLLGLLLNAQRVETRRSYGMLRAIRSAPGPMIPQEYFAALYDDPMEAAAMHALHAARAVAEENDTPTSEA